jgi:hypothetical protein
VTDEGGLVEGEEYFFQNGNESGIYIRNLHIFCGFEPCELRRSMVIELRTKAKAVSPWQNKATFNVGH